MADDITVGEAARLIQEGALLLDVREPDEWLAVRAPGALHIPMRDLPTSADRLPSTDRAILCICHVGQRSAVVAEALVHAGWQAVNVAGGMNAWEAAGLPVEHGAT